MRDDALVDLGDLGLEELLDEARIAARQDDLRAAGLAVDVLHVGDDAIARAVRLARRLLAEREDALGAAEVDDDVVALLEAPDDALDELALAVLELVEDEVALVVADALDEDLLGGLRGDAAEGRARLLQLEEVAELLVLLGGLLGVVRGARRSGSRAPRRAPPRGRASARPRSRSRARRRTRRRRRSCTGRGRPGRVVLVEARLELAVGPKTLCAALRIASSIVLTRSVLSIPLSFATCSRMLPRLVSEVGADESVAMLPSTPSREPRRPAFSLTCAGFNSRMAKKPTAKPIHPDFA